MPCTTVCVSPQKKEIVIEMVCSYFNIPRIVLMMQCRRTERVAARKCAIFLLYKWTECNKSEIARTLARDHTTVISALCDIDNILRTKQYPYQELMELDRRCEEAEDLIKQTA